VPQNRERVFIIGIRDDKDNNFTWPKKQHLYSRIKDVLEEDVDKKYFLTKKMINYLFTRKDNFNNGKISFKNDEEVANCINKSSGSIDISDNILKIKSATKNGYEVAKEGDSINLKYHNSKTRRGRVGKGVAQSLETTCNQATIIEHRGHTNILPKFIYTGIVPCIRAEAHGHESKVVLHLNPSTESNGNQPYKQNRIYETSGVSPVIDTECGRPGYLNNYAVRKLTPRECFRLMDFPDTFDFSVVSNNQAYKQAGNSIVVAVLVKLIEKLNLKQ